jgi:hypothetical protein
MINKVIKSQLFGTSRGRQCGEAAICAPTASANNVCHRLPDQHSLIPATGPDRTKPRHWSCTINTRWGHFLPGRKCGISVRRREASAVPRVATMRCCVPRAGGGPALCGVRKCLLEALKARDCLLEDLKRLPVLQDLVRKPALMGNGGDGNIGRSGLFPRKECLIEPVKLRKKERRSLLLLRDSVLRAASTTSPYTRRDLDGALGLLTVIVGKKLGVHVTEDHKRGR